MPCWGKDAGVGGAARKGVAAAIIISPQATGDVTTTKMGTRGHSRAQRGPHATSKGTRGPF